MKTKGLCPPAGFRDPRALAGLDATAPLCVALSGGADSVALLSMLAPTGHVTALHVHHGIRGKEADRDADFCQRLCDTLSVPLTVLRIDVPALAKERGVGLETAARDARYAAMTAHMERAAIPLLVTAHHADDQLETILQNLLRGSGLRGLCGIPACRPLGHGLFVARPLLSVPRTALLDYLKAMELTYVNDSTNAEPFCTRNRLRLDVLPTLTALAPHAAQNAARCAMSLTEDEAYLDALAADFIEKEGNEPQLTALAALPRPIFARVIQRLLPIAPERVHIEALSDFCQKATPHATLSLPGARVAAENHRFTLASEEKSPLDYEIFLKKGENEIPAINGLAVLVPSAGNCEFTPKNVYKYSTRISLSSAIINGKLSVRSRRAGDRILSGGMHKAVRRLPGLSHLPLPVRARMPLLTDESGILAVPFAAKRDSGKQKDDITVFLFFN